MAIAPTAAAPPADTGVDTAPDDTGAEQGQDQGSTVVCTICKLADGSYEVYAGDEPDEEGEGTPAEEGAEGQEGAEPQGQPAQSIGQALTVAHDVLSKDAEGDQGGNAALEEGFGGQGSIKAPMMGPQSGM